jgi:small subunit ribosomal protein S6
VNDYEILLLLDPEAPEERHEEILTRTRELVEKGGGAWEKHEPWGRRRLEYPIQKKEEGVYHLLLFKAEPEALDEVSRILRITDGVMRHMAVRRPKPSRRAETTPEPPVEAARPQEYAPTTPTSNAEPAEGA